MGNNVSKLHTKFHCARMQVHKDAKTKKIDLKINLFRDFLKSPPVKC